MKILLLCDPASSHSLKWAVSLKQKGHDLLIYGIHKCDTSGYDDLGIEVRYLGLNEKIKHVKNSSLSKLKYFYSLSEIKKCINEFQPDIMHAHYATSYGLLGALTNFHPYLISIWGSDIEEIQFPVKFRKRLLKFSFNRSDAILATSEYLKKAGERFTQKKILVTPFGIDSRLFIPKHVRKYFSEDDIVLGTIKLLHKTYGIDIFIRAFAKIKKENSNHNIKLLIVGGGPEESNLKKMADELLDKNDYVFTGQIPHNEVSEYHNNIDIGVYLSKREGFGVSILEAMSCEKIVIVSDAGALNEIVENGKSGLVVSTNNIENIVNAIRTVIADKSLRDSIRKNARERVLKHYNWDDCVNKMNAIYNNIIENK